MKIPKISNLMLFAVLSSVGLFSFTASAKARVADSYKSSCASVLMGLVNSGDHGSEKLMKRAQHYNGAPDEFMPSAENAPWAANYFPMDKGGIASRWQSSRPKAYKMLDEASDGSLLSFEETRAKVAALSTEKLSKLSPTEKYDILRGDYSFQTTRWELLNRGPERDPKPDSWEGFCNAMRAAGCLSSEPVRAITIRNDDGIEVELQPADIKALFGATYFYVEKYSALGTPHFGRGLDTDPPNAAAFHTALNALALKGNFAMVIDVENRGTEIWNESVVGYLRGMNEPRALTAAEARRAPRRATHAVDVDMELRALAEISIEDTNGATQRQVAAGELGINRIEYHYKLYIDDEGKTLEGEWVGEEWPDFVWFPGGRGTDAENGGNPYLDYDTVKKWADESAARE
ncbi:MAG: hypothetical protein ABIR96_08480 [Bdellovibrionota bacterium]